MSFLKRPRRGHESPRSAYDPPEAPPGPAQGALAPGTSTSADELEKARRTLADGRAFAPHCDQRILHEPGSCWACDLYPDWQKLRELWGIAFTGAPTSGDMPDPADYHRPPGSLSDHRQWPNNRADKEGG